MVTMRQGDERGFGEGLNKGIFFYYMRSHGKFSFEIMCRINFKKCVTLTEIYFEDLFITKISFCHKKVSITKKNSNTKTFLVKENFSNRSNILQYKNNFGHKKEFSLQKNCITDGKKSFCKKTSCVTEIFFGYRNKFLAQKKIS